jgi:hypothetical protein
MNLVAKTLAPLVAALLTACAGTYEQPPASQPRARMRIVQHPFTENTRMQIFELPDQCLPAKFDPMYEKFNVVAVLVGKGNLSPRTRGEIGMPNPPADKDSFSEVYLAAGKPFFYASYFESNYAWRSFQGCTIGTSFVPEAGVDYETRIELVAGGCRHSLRRLGTEGAPDVPVPMQRVTRYCQKSAVASGSR